jgi:hypothetical protein
MMGRLFPISLVAVVVLGLAGGALLGSRSNVAPTGPVIVQPGAAGGAPGGAPGASGGAAGAPGAAAPGGAAGGAGGAGATGARANVAQGQLARVEGKTLVLTGQAGEQKVVLDDQTALSKAAPGSLADLVAGANVVATARPGEGGALVAAAITVQPPGQANPTGAGPGAGGAPGGAAPGGGPGGGAAGGGRGAGGAAGGGAAGPGGAQVTLVQGQVTRVEGNTVTIATQGGPQAVTVGDQTRITKTVPATAEELTPGSNLVATGRAGEDGSLVAATVTIQAAGGTRGQ